MKIHLPMIKSNSQRHHFRVNEPLSLKTSTAKPQGRHLYAAEASGNLTQPHEEPNTQVPRPSLHVKSLGKLNKQIASLSPNVYIEKVWLIRRIGDLMSEDNRLLSAKQRKMKRKLNKKFKEFNRSSNSLLNLINQEANSADHVQVKRLKEALK